MRIQYGPIAVILLTGLVIIGCDTGDDLLQPYVPPEPNIAVSADTLTLDSTEVGLQTETSLTIYNTGDTTLELYEINTSDSSFSTNYDPADSLVTAGDSLVVTVHFVPDDTITYSDTLNISNNDELVEVALIGTGIEPIAPPPLQRTFLIVDKTYIFEDSCFVSHYLENSVLAEIQYFLVENDTVYLRGYQEIGSAPVDRKVVFTPAYPVLSSQWYGLFGYPALFSVTDSIEVIVPAGTFLAYIYSIADSSTGEPLGSMLVSEATGLVSMTQIYNDDSLSLVLEEYNITDGEGVFPLAVGNQWQLIEGNWTATEN
jgi:hypothetical protein